MKSKVHIGAYLAKGKKIKGLKRDVLVLVSLDEATMERPRPPKEVVLDRDADEGVGAAAASDALSNYIAALPDPEAVAGIFHRTHCHGLPIWEQHRARRTHRAPVMGPVPITQEIRLAIEAIAKSRGIPCGSTRELKGPALQAVEDFLGKAGLTFLNAAEKRAMMLALKIRSGNYAGRIAALQARLDKVVARKTKVRTIRLRKVS